MPVIRAITPTPSPADKQRIADQLKNEVHGTQTPNGPVIFEIPLAQQDRVDVLVVWDAWMDFGSIERSTLITDAYQGTGRKIAQALGVTYQEALDQHILPFAVVPMIRAGEANESQLKAAMLEEGAFQMQNGNLDLRFPTMAMAEAAHRALTDKIPKGYWSIVQTVGYIQ